MAELTLTGKPKGRKCRRERYEGATGGNAWDLIVLSGFATTGFERFLICDVCQGAEPRVNGFHTAFPLTSRDRSVFELYTSLVGRFGSRTAGKGSDQE